MEQATAMLDTQKLIRSIEPVGDLRSRAIEVLREAILTSVLRPGDRLNEQGLCDQLGISRPPLREAIRSLEHEGLVRSMPRKGSFVRTLTGHDVEEIYAVRCALEGMAAELVIEGASKEMIDELEELVLQVKESARDSLHELIELDLQFHRKLVGLANNKTLARMWSELVSQLHLALTLVKPSFYEIDYIEATHRPLVAAIRERNAEEAWRLIRRLREVGLYLKDPWERAAATPCSAPEDELVSGGLVDIMKRTTPGG